MSVQYDAGTRTARMTATRDQVCGGTAGSLVIMTAANAILATFALTTTGGTVTGDTWTLAFGSTTVTAAAAGIAAKAELRNNGGTAKVLGLTVGTSGADVIIDNTSIASGQQVQVTAAAITHAPNPA